MRHVRHCRRSNGSTSATELSKHNQARIVHVITHDRPPGLIVAPLFPEFAFASSDMTGRHGAPTTGANQFSYCCGPSLSRLNGDDLQMILEVDDGLSLSAESLLSVAEMV